MFELIIIRKIIRKRMEYLRLRRLGREIYEKEEMQANEITSKRQHDNL